MPQDINAGIAKMLISDGPVLYSRGRSVDNAGMGIVVDPRHILTCAHVVNTALGQPVEATTQPDRKVRVVFPLSESDQPIKGKVVVWHPMGAKPISDVAVIELKADVPTDVGVATFASVQPLENDPLKVFGFSAGSKKGNHVGAKFMGPTGVDEVQIDGTDVTGVFIQRGYSGAAVWDTSHRAVVGMVSARESNPADRVAYMIPLSTLKKAWPPLVPKTSRRTAWRYQVVAFDLDGTLLRGPDFHYSWRRVWEYLKLPLQTHRLSMRQYLESMWTYQKWCEWVCGKFIEKGLTHDDFHEIVKPLHVTKNFRSTLQSLKNEKFTLAIISGSIDTFLEISIPDYRDLFDYVFINKFQFDQYRRLSGVLATEFDFEGKVRALEQICQNVGCTIRESVFVGEGFNDQHAVTKAGLGIAYPPTVPQSEIYAGVVIYEDDLSRILEHILVL